MDPTADATLEARLRMDAKTWGGAPPPAVRARLHRTPVRMRARAPLLAAAVVAIAATLWFRAPRQPTPPLVLPRVDVAHLESMALAPLAHELANLLQDGRAVAEGVWRQVPPPLRRLLGNG